MTTDHNQQDPERVQALLLARLLPTTKRAPSRRDVVAGVASLLGAGSAREAATARVEEALAACAKAGWIHEHPPRLTSLGRTKLCALLDLERLPDLTSWTAVQRDLLLHVALGRKPSGRAKATPDLAAEVLQRAYDLPTGETLQKAIDRLAWRKLGVDTDAPFQAARVQRHLLREIVPEDARVDHPTFRRLVAGRSVGAARPDSDSLRRALLTRWLSARVPTHSAREPITIDSVVENDNAAPPSLPEFAAAVIEAARRPDVTRYHDDRAFIGSIWEHMRGKPPVLDMPLAEFKEKLVEAHRAQLLRMSRADLVQAMDPAEVQRSEAKYLSATFHFVALAAGGAQ